MSRHTFYRLWHGMKDRCENPASKNYRNYGGRGIKVCKRWRRFENFRDDMYRQYVSHRKANPESRNTSIERIDNGKGYGPANCKWATKYEQDRNRRNNRKVTHEGVTLTITDWSKRTGIHKTLIAYRLRRGWPVKDALMKKPR